MGAEVRPGTIDDVLTDEKNRVYSTPGLEAEGARLAQVAKAVDKLARMLVAPPRQQQRPQGPARPVPDRPRFEPKPAPSGVDPVRRQRPQG
jgi:hypothetical protein